MASAPTLIDSVEVSEITASKIKAGTIGAHEIILTQPGTQTSYTPPSSTAVLRSSNYSAGTAGWLIRGDGLAEFNDLTVRSRLDIGGDDASSFHVDNDGNMWLGAGILNYSTAPFRVSNTGQLTASSVTITNPVVTTPNITGGSITGSTITIGSGENVFKADSNGIYLGNETFASAEFRVTPAGALTATSADITGIVNASSGNIAGINMLTGRLYSGPNGNWANSNTGFYLDSSGYFSLKDKFYWNPDANGGAGQATFTGALSGASGSVTSNFSIGTGCVIGGSLSVGDNVRVNNATADNSATVFKVRGNTSGADTSKFIAKFQNNAPTDMLSIRDDGLVTVSQNLNVSGNVTVTGSINVGSVIGTTPFSGTVELNSAVYGSGIQSFTPASTNRFTLTLSSTAGANQYRIGTISSSIRFKQDISKMTFDAESYFKLQPSTFRWKEHVQEDLNADYDLGFIAEEAQELGLDNLWFADSDGIPEGIAYERVPLILWSIVSQQHETIKDLYAKIESLEEKIG